MNAKHPLLHIRRVADGVHDGIESKSDVGQPAQGVACERHLAIGKRAGQAQSGVSTQRRRGIQTTIEASDPGCALRIAGVGALVVVAGHIENAVAATKDDLVSQLIRGADAWGEILVLSIVKGSVTAGVEHQFARNIEPDRGADGVQCSEIKELLRVDPLGGSSLNFVAKSQVKGEPGSGSPGVLQIPAEEVLTRRRKLIKTSHSVAAPGA